LFSVSVEHLTCSPVFGSIKQSHQTEPLKYSPMSDLLPGALDLV
jgi:hypothetical protein